MITESFFIDIIKDLFSEYLPKSKSEARKEFTLALLDELKSHGFDFEEEAVSDDFLDSSFEDE